MEEKLLIAICALLILLLAGLVLKFFPPTKINSLCGYRTKRSMENINNWKLANEYSVNLMIYLSIFSLGLNGILFFLKVEQLTLSYIVFAEGIITAISVIAFTEKKLKPD
ncbi:MAG: SdpI family protein [Bacteroidetes bacterium]|nr:SdpI family protein [Bacteroidota bacterium]